MTDYEQAEQKIADFLEASGWTMECKFVPFSQSRDGFPKEKMRNHRLTDLSINWKVTVMCNGNSYTTDYTQGIGHLPKGLAQDAVTKRGRGGISLNDFDRYWSCLEYDEYPGTGKYNGNVRKAKRLQRPKITDVMFSLVIESDTMNYGSFSEWCDMLGHDDDSIKAKGIYDQCIEVGLFFIRTVGSNGLEELREQFQDY